MTRVRVLAAGDEGVLTRVASGVFDLPVRPGLVEEFLADPRHHLAVALEDDTVVGMATAVHYIHPDKAPELWVNEVGVSPDHRRKGLGRALMEILFEKGRELGCSEAWVLTDRTNQTAWHLYASLGGVEPPEEPVLFSFDLDAGAEDLENDLLADWDLGELEG